MIYFNLYINIFLYLYMKSYKINYGGYYKKNKIDNDSLLNLNLRPIIENNFFDLETNKKSKEKYLDFDYYYHRDNYELDSIESVEKFMEDTNAVNSAVKLISFWISKLWGESNFSESKDFCDDENTVCLDPKKINNLINDYPNIIRLFSDIGTGWGIGDLALGQGSLNLFGRGPIFQESKLSDQIKRVGLIGTAGVGLMGYGLLLTSSIEALSIGTSKALDKILEVMDKLPKLYYIKDYEHMYYYIKYMFFSKHATKEEKEFYKNNMKYIQNFFQKWTGTIDTTENNNYHASISRINNINKNISQIDKEIYQKKNEINNLNYHKTSNNYENEIDDLRNQINTLNDAKKFLDNTKKDLDKNKFLDEDLINAAHILRQACYIHKIRMLIYINYPEELNNYIEIENSTFLKEDKKNNNKMTEIYKKYQYNYPKNKWTKVLQTVRTQNYIGKNVVQKSFKNKIKDLVTPIIHLIENKIDNISDNLR